MLVDMIGDRLKQLRVDAGMNQPEFAAIVGTTKQFVSQLESGKNQKPNAELLEGWARHFRVNLRWLVSGTGPKNAPVPADDASDWSDIMGVRQAAALGDGAVADEYAETHKLKFRADSLRRKKLRPDKLAVIYGKGDSMHPTIKDGDAILIDTSDRAPKDGCLYVITYDGELLAKRLMELDGAWYAVSDNETDPKWRKPRRLDPSKGIDIAGRIRWVAGWVD